MLCNWKRQYLRKARKLLETGAAISISEVAYKVGFENQSSFSRLFKNHFGKSNHLVLICKRRINEIMC